MTDTHLAWVWEGSADPAALVLREIARPLLAPGQVLVRNAAIGLNPVDWKVLAGSVEGWRPGHVPGVDGAGVVVSVAADVPPEWIGRRVAYHGALARPGSFAEHTPVAARALLPMPEGLSFELGASVPCPALTAWLALDKLPERPGRALLVSGAGGGVGQALVQLATRRGFVVTAIAHARHHARLADLGVATCLEAPPATGRFFAAIDTVGSEMAAGLATLLAPSGHLVCIGDRVAGWLSAPFAETWSLHEIALGALHVHGDAADWARLVAAGTAILADLAQGRLRPETLVTGAFSDLPLQLAALRDRRFSGKPVVRVASFPSH